MISNEEYFNRGKSALLYFHNKAVLYPDYKLSFQELVHLVENRGYKNFLRGLGMGIIDGEISEYNVRGGMEKLAINGKGKIPATNGAFTQAIATDAAENISYVDAIAYVSKESVKDLAEISEKVGKGVLFGLDYWYLIIPVAIGAYVYIYAKASRS